MDNFLNNGAVLPTGLLENNMYAAVAGFNKTYKNFPLRIGVVVASYPTTDDNNHSKLTTEYDILVIEQNENQSTTPIKYKNCMSSEGLGSIADFFEKTLRTQTLKLNKGTTTLNDQNGAIVLLLCLDAMSDKAIIISALTHPNRPTTLTSTLPYLQGEYNGVNVVVNTDGSTTLTFNGATDNLGNPLIPTQGVTQLSIKNDGSFQINNSTVLFSMAKSGKVTLTSASDININSVAGNVNLNITGNANIIANGTTTVQGTQVMLQSPTNIINGGVITNNPINNDPITGLPLIPSGGVFTALGVPPVPSAPVIPVPPKTPKVLT